MSFLRAAVQLLSRRTRTLARAVYWHLTQHRHESLYFISLHKCATSLFTQHVLNQHPSLRLVNYQGRAYQGELDRPPTFHETGHVYGALRIIPPIPTTRCMRS
jgi:hypothetical protein